MGSAEALKALQICATALHAMSQTSSMTSSAAASTLRQPSERNSDMLSIASVEHAPAESAISSNNIQHDLSITTASSKTFSFSTKNDSPTSTFFIHSVAKKKSSSYKNTGTTKAFKKEAKSPTGIIRSMQAFGIPAADIAVSEISINIDKATAKYDHITTVTTITTSDFRKFFRLCTWSTSVVVSSSDSSTAERFCEDLVKSEVEIYQCKLVTIKGFLSTPALAKMLQMFQYVDYMDLSNLKLSLSTFYFNQLIPMLPKVLYDLSLNATIFNDCNMLSDIESLLELSSSNHHIERITVYTAGCYTLSDFQKILQTILDKLTCFKVFNIVIKCPPSVDIVATLVSTGFQYEGTTVSSHFGDCKPLVVFRKSDKGICLTFTFCTTS